MAKSKKKIPVKKTKKKNAKPNGPVKPSSGGDHPPPPPGKP